MRETQTVVASIFLLLLSICVAAQRDLDPIIQTEAAFDKAISDRGERSAFLEFLSDDAIVFQPSAVNGVRYWNSRPDDPATLLVRNPTYSDIAANGLMGYTTGNWRTFQKGKSEGLAKFGQYVTIWERKPDGRFRASLDIAVMHDKLPFSETDKPVRMKQTRDINKRGWSPADASMNFLRASMTNEKLGGAYERYSGDDVRLLREGYPPLIGKKQVVETMRDYISILFPQKVALYQSADMAYTWNNCSFDNSNEGQVQGNCLHIWKLRKKKWWIVLGVFSPLPNDRPPVLKFSTKK